MARARGAAASSTSGEAASGGQTPEAFTCPECGKEFTRAASLGAHRQRVHGVAGAKAKTRSRRRVAAVRRRAPAAATTSAGAAAAPNGGVDRDALLQAVFPNGLPAREEVLRRANAWLDEAEQLAAATQ
jgi:predicted RNA-binding Zn-ribbon protein involved in translation (DUF1610 family)